MCEKCLKWKENERRELESRILKLTYTQIVELFGKVGITFPGTPMKEIISEIRQHENDSGDLDILFREASSKGDLKKWVKYFEKQND